jgi:hypothetical protein
VNLIMWGNEKMFIKLILILSVLVSVNAMAGDVYTCTVSGKTVYQGKPCAGSKALIEKVSQAKANEKAKELAKYRYEVEMRERSSRKEPGIGMSADAAINSSWGYPDDVNKTVNAYGVSEQWVYRGGGYSKGRYLYFKNGILTSMQE